MLSKEQIEILTDKYITGLYDSLENEVIADIARRVKKMDRYTETAELQAMAMREQGYSASKIQHEVLRILNVDEDYQKALAENTKEYKQEIKQIIKETVEKAQKAGDMLVGTAGEMSWNDDMQAWQKHDIDLKKPNGLKQLYAGIAKQTNGELKNITRSSGFKGTTLGTTGVLNAYRRIMDLATIKMSTGAFSYQTAVKDCVKMLADSGLRTIDYASGRSYQLDTAARMCIRTGMAQLSGKIQELNLQQTNTPLVYVDAHAGSRPEHAVWQGKVYAYDPNGKLADGSKAGEKYGDFFNETDYGSPTGLMGVNCAHHFYPYWEGDPVPEFTMPDPMEINGKEYTYYEATQEMRKQERGIRKTKREIEAMRTLGEDTTLLKKKLRQQEKDYLAFSDKSGINPRDYALGVQPGTSKMPNKKPEQQTEKSVENSNKPLTNADKSGTIKSQMKNVYTYGHRNEKDLTEKQIDYAKQAARKQGYKGDMDYSPNSLTAIIDYKDDNGEKSGKGSLLIIGTDVYPGENAVTANEKLTPDCCMAHEIVGHHEAWLRNTTQDDPVIEEAQASIRGALFGVGLSNEERQLLMQDASERLAKVGKTIEDVEDLIDIKER